MPEVDVFRYHEISEAGHRILNPLSAAKQDLLGELCGLHDRQRQLDLACGKGELLCQFARRHGIRGRGIDLFEPFIVEARARAEELGVSAQLEFVHGDAADPVADEPFDVVSCIGATWIGGGLGGALRLMARAARPGAWLLVGEVYWREEPPAEYRAREEAHQQFFDLGGTLEVIEGAGCELVELVLASEDDWDRYAASQWLAVSEWVRANPGHPWAAELTETSAASRREYLSVQRRCMGWGVFVLRAPSSGSDQA